MGSHVKYTLERDKQVDVFDGIFSLTFRTLAYDFALKSYYRIGWDDTDVPERKARDNKLHSVYSLDDLNALGILKELSNSYVGQFIADYRVVRSVMNLTMCNDVNYIHAHPESKTLLYYVNLEWAEGWHGETVFYSEDQKSVQFTSPYTPGRLILFDGQIPHGIRPQSVIAPQYRFTLALCMEKAS